METLLQFFGKVGDVLQYMWQRVWDFFTAPLAMWRDGYMVPAVFMGFVDVAIAFVVVLLVCFAIWGLIRRIIWLVRRKHCHNCGRWTTRRGDGRILGCEAGVACCESCTLRHKSDNEPRYECVVDRTRMHKQTIDGMIIDVCPSCGRMVLTVDEQEHFGLTPGDDEAMGGLARLGF